MEATKKAAIVTGASRGIGLAIASLLAGRGFDLTICARHDGELQRAAGTLSKTGAKVLALAGDVADASFTKNLVEKTVSQFGRMSVLVNNAGIVHRSLVADMDAERWDEVFAVNVRAPMLLTKLSLPHLRRQTESAIINIVSGAAYFGMAGSGAYSAAKHTLLGLSRSLFEEVREFGVKVVAISPGFVRTEMVSGRPGLDNGKMITPEDVANTVAYVLDLSPHACPTEITLRPQQSPYVG